jgi:hypothetical protein
MELKVNLLEKKEKSLFRIILGIFGIVIVILYFIFLVKKSVIDPSFWVYLITIVCFAITGAYNLIEGLGYRLESFSGKAYILINSEIISLKAKVFKKEQFINWNEIKSIDYNKFATEFKIKKNDDTTMIIDISEFDFILIGEIKKVIDCIAKEKNIQSNV